MWFISQQAHNCGAPPGISRRKRGRVMSQQIRDLNRHGSMISKLCVCVYKSNVWNLWGWQVHSSFYVCSMLFCFLHVPVFCALPCADSMGRPRPISSGQDQTFLWVAVGAIALCIPVVLVNFYLLRSLQCLAGCKLWCFIITIPN